MRNAAKYIAAFVIAVICLIPPVFIQIHATVNTTAWMWGILLGGFLGFLYLFTKANPWVKALVVFSFVGCFSSSVPYLSFSLYLSVILGAYFYLMCLSIDDWEPVYKTIQSLFFVSVLLIVMQRFQGDTLLNFNRKAAVFFGTINNPMMLASYITCLTPFLIMRNRLNAIPVLLVAVMSQSAGMVFSLGAGILFYLCFKIKNKWVSVLVALTLMVMAFALVRKDTAVINFMDGGRGKIWQRTIELVEKSPWMGRGIGTFQVIFPVFSADISGGFAGDWNYEWTIGSWIAWRKTHNCWLQLYFEIGRLGIIGILGLAFSYLWMFIRVHKTPVIIFATVGMVILAANMTVHFPTRMPQTVIVLLSYLAFYEFILKKGEVKYALR